MILHTKSVSFLSFIKLEIKEWYLVRVPIHLYLKDYKLIFMCTFLEYCAEYYVHLEPGRNCM